MGIMVIPVIVIANTLFLDQTNILICPTSGYTNCEVKYYIDNSEIGNNTLNPGQTFQAELYGTPTTTTTSTTTTTTTSTSTSTTTQPTCGFPLGHWAYCSLWSCGPCDEGEGDCDSDKECKLGLSCVHNVGVKYGWNKYVDVCESQPIVSTTTTTIPPITYLRTEEELYNYIKNYGGTESEMNNDLKYMCENASPWSGLPNYYISNKTMVYKHYIEDGWTRSDCVLKQDYTYNNTQCTDYFGIWTLKYRNTPQGREVDMTLGYKPIPWANCTCETPWVCGVCRTGGYIPGGYSNYLDARLPIP